MIFIFMLAQYCKLYKLKIATRFRFDLHEKTSFVIRKSNATRYVCIGDDLLTRKWEVIMEKKLIIRRYLQKHVCNIEVLKDVHDSPSEGHFGEIRMLANIRGRYYWVNYRPDFENCIKRCDLCAYKNSQKTRSEGKLNQFI